MIDKACLLWQDQCGRQGSCFVYQNAAMSQYMLIAGLVYKVSRGVQGLLQPARGPGTPPGPLILGAEGITPAWCAEAVSFHI